MPAREAAWGRDVLAHGWAGSESQWFGTGGGGGSFFAATAEASANAARQATESRAIVGLAQQARGRLRSQAAHDTV
jgi:hypothetical protein